MGVDVRILLFAENETQAEQSSRAAFNRINQINHICSDYLANSEVSKLSRTHNEWVSVSDDLWAVLSYAQSLSEKTRGAFDITGGRLSIEWRKARFTQRLPDPAAMERAKNSVSYHHLILNPETREVKLSHPGMKIDLGALAKGYAADKALEVISQRGHNYALIDASGDMVMSAHPDGSWPLFINDQNNSKDALALKLQHCAVATSGASLQHLEIDHTTHSHIYNPATGSALTHNLQCSIIAPSCMQADALATAASVLGAKKGRMLINQFEDTEAYFKSPTEIISTKNFLQFAHRD